VVEWLPQLNTTNWLDQWDPEVDPSPAGQPITQPVPVFFRIRAFPILAPTDPAEMLVLYSNAVVDASVALPNETWPKLTAITESNTNLAWRINADGTQQVKVVSFMRYQTATNYYSLGDHLLSFGDQWVTAYPELKQICGRYQGTDPVLRIKQVLGMPPTSANDTIVEFWVSPDYLFRPTPDPEINDTSAGLVDSLAAPLMGPSVRVHSFYVAWFNSTYATRNYGMTNGVFNSYPWTRLGYTYDWANTQPPHVGLSEFVIPSGSLSSQLDTKVPIEVVNITSAATYGAN
jgi:hypothetical protein